MTLRTRLTAAFLLVVLVPVLVGAALALGLFPRAAGSAQGDGLTAGAGLAVSAVGERCRRVEHLAEAVAQAAGQDDRALRAAVTRLRASDARGTGVLDGVLVLDAAGTVRLRAGEVPALPAGDCRSAELARAGTVTSLAVVLPLERATSPGAAPSPAGQVVVATTVDDDDAEQLRAAAGAGAVVLLADGRPVASSGRVDDVVVRTALSSVGPVRTAGQVAVAVRLDDQPLGVLLVQEQGWRTLPPALVLPALLVTAAAVAALIGAGLARDLTRPLAELARAATRVAEGDLTPRVRERSGDEVGQLGAAFNVMTTRLAAQVDALEDSREQLREGVTRIGSALAGTHDLSRLLPVVLETAVGATRARSGAVLLRDDATGDLVLSVGRGLGARGVPDDLRVAAGAGVSGSVDRTGLPVRGRTGSGAGELVPAPGEPLGADVLAVPLSSSERDVGVLLLWDRAANEGGTASSGDGSGTGFAEDDLATLLAFARQATVAVDNVQLHEELRRQSVTDGLTGVANFRAFHVTVDRELERARRFGRPVALLLLDLDRFKAVNDVWGHQRGDAVLVELVGRLRAQVRDVDTVARYGGEEFVVVLPETDGPGAAAAAERICAAVRAEPFGAGGPPPLAVTVSIGAAVFPEHGTSAPDLLRGADEAMYAAKHGGRDGWRLARAQAAPAGGASVGSPP